MTSAETTTTVKPENGEHKKAGSNKKKVAAEGTSEVITGSSGKRVTRPDRVVFNRQVEDLTREIDAVKAKLVLLSPLYYYYYYHYEYYQYFC